jgi:hypothetical protein
VRLGRGVHDHVHLGHGLPHQLGVADVAVDEREPLVGHHVGEVLDVARVRERVERDDLVRRLREQVADEVGRDEPGAAGNENSLGHHGAEAYRARDYDPSVIAARELTEDEYTVLDYLYECGWDYESFGALRPVTRDAADVPRLRDAVAGLFAMGLIEIRQTGDFDPDYPGRLLSRPEATEALDDDRAWAIPDEPVFDGTGDYFVVAAQQAAIAAYWRARNSGKQHDCGHIGFG